MDSSYGNYVWPAALILSNYVWHHRKLFENRTILEVGAGTSLPSLILSKINHPPNLIITDEPSVIQVARSCFTLNNISLPSSSIWIRSLVWGELGTGNSIDQLLEDLTKQWKNKKIDYILGSDTFYDPKDFDKLLMTVAYIIHHHYSSCKFITAYQERSSKRSIQFLLDKWSLQCRLIPKDSFDFDAAQFTEDNLDEDHNSNTTPPIKIDSGALSSVFLLEISAKNQ
ncbi:putative methyltransferase-domain-containing protein [Cunninghamella echinulata]|nr:putative methyltransferase-domain-containing protein [Cunninghamella echinulata]